MIRRTAALATRRASWILLGVVVAVALAIGSYHPVAQSVAARAAAIESDVKCPSCEDLSVRQSNTPPSPAIRTEITRLVAAGRSDAAIEATLVSTYGPGIILRPASTGIDLLVWVVPVIAFGLGAGGIAGLAWRRRRRPGVGETAASVEDEALVAAILGTGERTAGHGTVDR